MKIIRASDKVKIKIHSTEVVIQPLTYGKRVEMAKFVKVQDGKEVQDYANSMMFLVKNTVKGISLEGESIPLEFKDDELTEESMSDVMGILEGNQEAFKDIAIVSSSAGKPASKVIDPLNKSEIEGVEVSILPKA